MYGRRRWGIRRHVLIAPWTDYVEVHWAHDAEAYVTPVADDCVGVAILTSRRGGFDSHLDAFPSLKNRVDGSAHGTDRAAGPLRQRVRSRTAGRVLLVGDAAGYVDALTGEGLGLAFGAAELLVDCVVADRPGDYDREWRRMTRRYRLLTAALAACERIRAAALTDRAGRRSAAQGLRRHRQQACGVTRTPSRAVANPRSTPARAPRNPRGRC